MPKSRGRRKKSGRSRGPVRRQPIDSSSIDWAMFERLQAVAEAEARGDAHGAMLLIGAQPRADDGELFWHPARVQRLAQLVQLEGLIPRWAVSRWILAQARTVLDRRLNASHAEALRVVTDLRGGPNALPGRDDLDRQVKVADLDWVYRQLCLYEHGGLDFFLAHHAAPDLVAGSDGIGAWGSAPMRALRFDGREPTLLHYEDLATGQPHTVPNSGAAVFTMPGEHVLGRVVPVDGGEMFDGLPLLVPRDVAEDCASAPLDWVAALRRGVRRDRVPEERMRFAGAGHNQLLTDVPEVGWQLPMLSFTGRITARPLTPEIVAEAVFETVRAAMDGSLDRHFRLDHEEDDVDPWPCVAAALVHPRHLGRLEDELAGTDPSALLALADKLLGPAADLCRAIAEPGAGAA